MFNKLFLLLKKDKKTNASFSLPEKGGSIGYKWTDSDFLFLLKFGVTMFSKRD